MVAAGGCPTEERDMAELCGPACRSPSRVLSPSGTVSPFGQCAIQPRQAARVGRGAGHRTAVAGADRVGPGHMVAVMVGEQDHVQAAASRLDRRNRGICVGGVDESGHAGRVIPQQPGVVVGQERAAWGRTGSFGAPLRMAAPCRTWVPDQAGPHRASREALGSGCANRGVMTADAHTATEFYATARGAVASRLIRNRLAVAWPDLTGCAVLGLGYTAPYLRHWRDSAARCIAATPAQVGARAGRPAAQTSPARSKKTAYRSQTSALTASCWCMGWRLPRTPAACCGRFGAC